MVEEGNLFDPARPSLGSELEALRQHLEALSASPDPWDSRAARPAGVPGGRSGARARGQRSAGFEAGLGRFLPRAPRPHPCPALARSLLPVTVASHSGSCWELSSEALWGSLAGLQPCLSACPVSSFSLDSVARDPRELWRFLTQNLSLPDSAARALLAAQVDLPEVRAGSLSGAPVSAPGSPLPWSSAGSHGGAGLEPQQLIHDPVTLRSIACFLALRLAWTGVQGRPGISSPCSRWR